MVGDVRTLDLGTAPPRMVYVPTWYRARGGGVFVLRTANDPAAMADPVRKAIWSIDAQVPVPEIRTMETVVDGSLAARNFQLHLLLAFAACALILAALGIYGVVAYSALQRTREFGIRIALGAQPAQIYRLILEDGVTPGPARRHRRYRTRRARPPAPSVGSSTGSGPSISASPPAPPSSCSSPVASPACCPPSAPPTSIPSRPSAPNKPVDAA